MTIARYQLTFLRVKIKNMITGRPIFENIPYVYRLNAHADNMHVVTLKRLVLQ